MEDENTKVRRTVASGFHEVRRKGGGEGGREGEGDRMRKRENEREKRKEKGGEKDKGMGEQEVWPQQEFLLHR